MKPEDLKVGMRVRWKGVPYKIISLQNGRIKLREMSKSGGIVFGAMAIKAEDLEEDANADAKKCKRS